MRLSDALAFLLGWLLVPPVSIGRHDEELERYSNTLLARGVGRALNQDQTRTLLGTPSHDHKQRYGPKER